MLCPSRPLKFSPYHEASQVSFLKPFMCSLKLHSEFLSRTCSLNLSVGFQAQEALFSGFLALFLIFFCVCYEGVGARMWVQVWGHTGGGERTGFHSSCPVHTSGLKNSISQLPRICQVGYSGWLENSMGAFLCLTVLGLQACVNTHSFSRGLCGLNSGPCEAAFYHWSALLVLISASGMHASLSSSIVCSFFKVTDLGLLSSLEHSEPMVLISVVSILLCLRECGGLRRGRDKEAVSGREFET